MDPRNYYFEYLKSTRDADAHFYEIATSPYESPIVSGSLCFGPETYPLTIIDQFSGKRPVLFNLAFLDSPNRYELYSIATILLDSHIATELHRFRIGAAMRPDVRGAIENFLRYVSDVRCDYNPLFYLLESYCKSTPEAFVEYASPVAESLLHLHSMDEKIFLESGKITIKPDALAHYYNKYGASSLKECGRAWTEQFTRDNSFNQLNNLIEFSYACIMKMVLLHKMDPRPAHKKLEDFERFCLEELGLLMGREMHLAAYYFADLTGRLISTQRGSGLGKTKRDLRATAWDLFLLRLPEQLLTPRHLPEMNLAYICTAEKKLSELAQLFTVERVAARSDDSGIQSAVSMNLAKLEEKLGHSTIVRIIDKFQESAIKRALEEKKPPINETKLRHLVEDLEIQLSYLCKV